MRKYFDDLLILLGCGCIVYGAYLVNPVAAWIVGGLILVALGILAGWEAR